MCQIKNFNKTYIFFNSKIVFVLVLSKIYNLGIKILIRHVAPLSSNDVVFEIFHCQLTKPLAGFCLIVFGSLTLTQDPFWNCSHSLLI